MFPYWTEVPPVKRILVYLIFSGLPKRFAKLFDFVEEIPQEGGFLVTDIDRNESDVYTIKLI